MTISNLSGAREDLGNDGNIRLYVITSTYKVY